MKCPHCDKEIFPGQFLCDHCGKVVKGFEKPKAEKPKKTAKEK